MYYLIARELEIVPIWVALVELAIILIAIILQALETLNILQLNSYNVDQHLIWIKKNKKKYRLNKILLIFDLLLTIILFVSIALVGDIYFAMLVIYIWPVILEITFIIFSIIKICLFFKNRIKKKKFVYTNRIKRNILANIILYAIIILPIILMIKNNNASDDEVFIELLFKYFFLIFAPMLTFISFLIMLPIENILKKNIINKAKKKLKANTNINVIGITGSYGKTSVKNFLKNILSIKYNVCMSPGSYNVPMGACITINEHLKSYDDIFIQEMGARRIGDIKEMCDIVEPNDCIITEVGNMHLDTFKNIENVLKTKMELFEYVNNKNGIILLNGDNDLIREYVNNKNIDNENRNIYFIGEKNNNNFIINNIKSNRNGASFNIKICDNNDEKVLSIIESIGDNIDFNTKLIGKNNIIDISFAIAYAILKNIDVENIKEEVKRLEQVKNRLEIINVDNDTIIINDAYNSNPNGARNAIDAVSTFDGYKKIMVTPGMVELGDIQYAENKKMIEYAENKIDEIVIVGTTNRDALKDGAKNNQKIKIYNKEEDAIIYARSQNEKKVILLENDLPDNY